MSRPRRKRAPVSPAEAVRRLFGPLQGARVPGGCEECAAWQEVEPVEAGTWVLLIVHDDDCPALARMEGHS